MTYMHDTDTRYMLHTKAHTEMRKRGSVPKLFLATYLPTLNRHVS